MKQTHVFKGTIVHSLSPTELKIIERGALVVDEHGKIIEVTQKIDFKTYPNCIIHDFKDKIICPGFIDLHVHLPQYAFVGQGADELLAWLEKYTFPAEKRFENSEFAGNCSAIFFDELLSYGTTTAAVYPTLHKEATDIAFGYAAHLGLRLIMGKVLMDQNSPTGLTEDTEKGMDESVELLEKWHGFDNHRIQYAFTPRFAITCSERSMQKVGDAAKKYNVFIQTHLSENRGELEAVKSFFPKAKSYADVYYSSGILTEKTLLAHCIYLSETEKNYLKETGAVPVHCPTSNRFLQSGVFPFRKNEAEGLTIGLGSDVAGGYELSMLHEMKEAIEMSKVNNIIHYQDKQNVLSQNEAFYYGTLGGAKAIGMDHIIGNFETGKEADFLVLDDSEINPFNDFDFYQETEHRISRLIYRSSKSCVKAVYIRGKRLK